MHYTITLRNHREFNAVLAGLRSLQIADPALYAPIHAILTDGGCSPITADEIDDLCGRINTQDTEVSS